MELEFRKDVTGELQATCSMGNEAMAAWLLEEVGYRVSVLPAIYQAITQLQKRERWEFYMEGAEYNLRLSRTEAEVCNARIDFDADGMSNDHTDMAEDLDFYDDEARSCCGLDDFRGMLVEWEAFVGQT